MNYNFIKTSDKATADKLLMYGLQLIDYSNNVYTFLNQQTNNFNFSNIDVKKLVYTNTLVF